jgi:hypothetical protein
MNVAGEGFERGAVERSCACRIGRGNLAAVQMAAGFTGKHRFFLKLDIRRYFDSIDHETLRGLFRRRFKDGAFLAVLDRIVGSFGAAPESGPGVPPSNGFQVEPSWLAEGERERGHPGRPSRHPASKPRRSLASTDEGRGLPIGSLTSQYFANLYLDGLDHYIMETLGCGAYVRYMDDFVLWHDEEARLSAWREQIESWVHSERRLELKGSPRPMRCAEGLPFLGYRITPRRILLGRMARRRFRSRLAGYEKAHAEGVLSEAELQRRADALLAFARAAECAGWRRRILASPPFTASP